MRRLSNTKAMLAGMILIGSGWSAPAHAGIVINTPAGLTPGDQFRIVFVTDGGTSATSSNISDYDAFVTAQAGGATYDGQTVTWQAIGSTPTVNAIDHITQTNTQVYLNDGTEVTNSTTPAGMWSGSLNHPINEDLTGSTINQLVWTGTLSTGQGLSGETLGTSSPIQGSSSTNNDFWIAFVGAEPTTGAPLYGISEVLTVQATVPEPSGLLLAGTGLAMVGVYGLTRRYRK
jgi:hypothetical protein